MQDRVKMWRREATTDRALAVALYHECRRAGMTPRAERVGHQFVVVARANEWDLWRCLNRARQTVKAKREAGQAQASQPEYFADDSGHCLEGDNLPYFLAIYDEARHRGFDAQHRRVEGTGNRYRVAVWECSQQQFSEILRSASRAVSEAVAA